MNEEWTELTTGTNMQCGNNSNRTLKEKVIDSWMIKENTKAVEKQISKIQRRACSIILYHCGKDDKKEEVAKHVVWTRRGTC